MVGKMAITTEMGALATPLYHMDTRKCEVVVWWVEMPPLDRNFHTMIIMHYDIYRAEVDETLESELRWLIEHFRPHLVVSPTFHDMGQIYVPGDVFGVSRTRATHPPGLHSWRAEGGRSAPWSPHESLI